MEQKMEKWIEDCRKLFEGLNEGTVEYEDIDNLLAEFVFTVRGLVIDARSDKDVSLAEVEALVLVNKGAKSVLEGLRKIKAGGEILDVFAERRSNE